MLVQGSLGHEFLCFSSAGIGGARGLAFFHWMVLVSLGGVSVDRIFIGIKLMKKYLPVFFIILLSGCADPLPEDRLDYVGEWRSKEMGLLILADGSVSYKRLKGGATTSVSGPLKRFEGDDFVVGVLFMTTTFDVTEAPHEIGGAWTMTVDGVRLTRVSE